MSGDHGCIGLSALARDSFATWGAAPGWYETGPLALKAGPALNRTPLPAPPAPHPFAQTVVIYKDTPYDSASARTFSPATSSESPIAMSRPA